MLRLSGRLSEHRATLLSGPHCSLQPKTLRWYEFDMTVKCQLCTYMQGPAPFQLRVEWKDRGGEEDRGGKIRWRNISKGEWAGRENNLLQESGVCYFPDPHIVNKKLPMKHWWAIKRLRGYVFFFFFYQLACHILLASATSVIDWLLLSVQGLLNYKHDYYTGFIFNAGQIIWFFFFTC